MYYDSEIPSLGKRPRVIVTQTLKGTCRRMCITEDVHHAIICVMRSWRQFSKKINKNAVNAYKEIPCSSQEQIYLYLKVT